MEQPRIVAVQILVSTKTSSKVVLHQTPIVLLH